MHIIVIIYLLLGTCKQNYIFRNLGLGVLISARSEPKLKRNMIFCNGRSIEITKEAIGTLRRLNNIFDNGHNNLQVENE